MDRVLKGSLYVLLAAALWGAMPIVETAALVYVNPIVLAAWRYFLAGLVIFVFLKARRVNIFVGNISGKKLFLAALVGSTLSPIFFYYGLLLTDPVTAVSIANTGVLWVGLLGVILLKEKIKKDEIIGTILIFLGVYVILNNIVLEASIGALMLLLASFSGALALVLHRGILHRVNPWVVTLYDRLAGGSFALIIALVLVGSGAIFVQIQGWYYIIFLTFFSAIIPGVILLFGLRLLEAERAAALFSTLPLFTMLFTVLFTNNPITDNQILGVVLIVSGAMVLSISKKLVWTLHHYTAFIVHYERNGMKNIKQTLWAIEKKIKNR